MNIQKPTTPAAIPLLTHNSKHGKFRPTLMGLVSSNDASSVATTIKDALGPYRQAPEPDTPAALGALARLRGVGPATASLLLAVHDPERVVFFSDEAFCWLCRHGRRGPIRYSAGEYRALGEGARALAGRLGVAAVDVERVAYVLMNDGDAGPAMPAGAPSGAPSGMTGKTARGGDAQHGNSKRRQSPVVDDGARVLRSKRTRRV